jgi:hypothetical protein
MMGLFQRCRHGMQPRFRMSQHIGLCSYFLRRSKAPLLIDRYRKRIVCRPGQAKREPGPIHRI